MEDIKPVINKIENKQPSNIEAEQALLGSILVNNDIIDEISSIINSTIFYDPAHIKIYEVIENLNNKGMIANPITLKNFFENEKDDLEVNIEEMMSKNSDLDQTIKQLENQIKVIEKEFVSMTSMNTWVYEEDIGRICSFLISNDAPRISGQVIAVDGNTLRMH